MNISESNPTRAWTEYDWAAEWCAKRGLSGAVGTELPQAMSSEAVALVNDDVEAFETRVKAFAYAQATEKIHAKYGEAE